MKKKANTSSMVGLAARRKNVVADFKKYFQTVPPSSTLREKLINNIMFYAGDEFEDRGSIIELAIQSEEELIDRLIHILDYYHEQYQEFS